MKAKFVVLLPAVLSVSAFAYERSSLLNLTTPSELEAKQMAIGIFHRFN